MGHFRYRLFDLLFDSDLELPELPPGGAGEADVAVTLVKEASSGEDCFSIGQVATYRIPDARTIEVVIAPAADPVKVRLFLLGSAMSFLLYRRGDLPIHANAIKMGGAAWMFAGPTGSGKSTLAAWCTRRGHQMLADDVCVIRESSNGHPIVVPGLPRIRLWEDAALREGFDPGQLQPSFPGDPDYRKFDVVIGDQAARDPVPLAAICLLDVGSELLIEPLGGSAAIEALFANSYRGENLASVGDLERHWRSCVALAQKVPLFRFARSFSVDRMDRENEAAIKEIGRLMRQLAR